MGIDSGKKKAIKTLGDLGDVKRGLSSYYMRNGEVVVPMVTLKDIQDGRIVSETVDHISVRKTNLLETSRLAPGDVVITIKGTNFRAAVVDEPAAGFMISANLIALTLSDQILPEIVAAYLNSPRGQRELEARAGGSAIKGLNTKSLLEVPIPVPPIEQQEALSRYISSAHEYEALIKKELELRNQINYEIIRRVMG
jgi:restriction endonuclease S subunit